MTDKLEDGFYWVRYVTWVPARFFKSSDVFHLTGYNGYLARHELDEIDQRPIKREGGE